MSEVDWKDPAIIAMYEAADVITISSARELIKVSGVLDRNEEPIKVFDNGAGLGVIAKVLYGELGFGKPGHARGELLNGDISQAMMDWLKDRADQQGWKNFETKVIDAQDTKLPSDQFDAVIASLVYMTLPDADAALKESLRILKPGRKSVLTSWKTPGYVADVWPAAEQIPGIPQLFDVGIPCHCYDDTWASPDWVKQKLESIGFVDVEARLFPMEVEFENVDAFMAANALPISATGMMWSPEDREKYMPQLERKTREHVRKRWNGDKGTQTWIAVLASGTKPQ